MNLNVENCTGLLGKKYIWQNISPLIWYYFPPGNQLVSKAILFYYRIHLCLRGKCKNIVITAQNLLTQEMLTTCLNDVLFILMVYFSPTHLKCCHSADSGRFQADSQYLEGELAGPSTQPVGKGGVLACGQGFLCGVVPAFLIRLVNAGNCKPQSKLDCKTIIQVNAILA